MWPHKLRRVKSTQKSQFLVNSQHVEVSNIEDICSSRRHCSYCVDSARQGSHVMFAF